jgi:hypothetical protein
MPWALPVTRANQVPVNLPDLHKTTTDLCSLKN